MRVPLLACAPGTELQTLATSVDGDDPIDDTLLETLLGMAKAIPTRRAGSVRLRIERGRDAVVLH